MAYEPRQPMTESRPLLERRRELDALDSTLSKLHRAVEGMPQARAGGLLAFTGAAGLGKTALITQARARAEALGFTVFSGRGGEREQEVAFRVVRQLVQPALAAMDDAELRTFLGSWYDIVAGALGLEATDTAHAPDPTGVRDGLDWVMTRLTMRESPVVLLLDDLHWADAESLSWLASFAPRAADLPLLIVVAYRPDELPPEAAAFRTLVTHHGNRPYVLEPLTRAGVARIIRDEVGDGAEDDFCEKCFKATDGSPLNTVELAIGLAQRKVKGTDDDLSLMRDIASAVSGPGLIERLLKLGPTTVRFAQAAAVLGAPFSPELAAAVAVIGREDSIEAIEKLRVARIVADGEGPGGSLDFVHSLIPTTIYRHIKPALRVFMHNTAALAVRDAGFSAAKTSRHLLELPCEGKTEVVECLREAAREFLRAGAPESARRVLARALLEPPLPEDRAVLLHELAGATFLIEPTATVTLLKEALAQTGMDPALRASIVYRLTQALAHTDQLAEAAAVADDESRQTTNARIRLRMQADHFVWSSFRTDEPDAPARSRRLAKLARQLTGRGLEERRILGLRAWDGVLRGEPRQGVLATAEEALRDGLSWTDENRGFEVPVSVALVFMYCDQPRRAEELFADGIAECEAKGWRGSHLALGQTLYGYICYRRGLLVDAEELAREGLRTAEKVEGAVPAQWFAVGILIQTLLARGRTPEARKIADQYRYGEMVPNAVIYPDPRSVYAELLIAEGRHGEAERLLSGLGEWLDSRGWRNPAWCRWQLNLAQAVAATDPERAVPLARDAVKRARDFGAASVIGQALRVEAEVTAGPAALDVHAEAVEHLEGSPASYELARALVGHGAALSRNGLLQEAANRLYQGLESAVHCGAETLAARAREELSAAGLRPLPLRYGQTDTLTVQERKTAELTVQGQPVAVVAKELRLTEQGVRQLLSSVYRKIGTDATDLAAALADFPGARH
ncbi:AAA ATPase domain-containing protein [Streptomyces sp. yr375]|uniref:ATP-binding protein n=1 Tax=Streptomyces sp. yr375 TaxID=1761906 RepID=UPI0008CDD7A1|nr:AAA family ATPase [Streptomyces sp. yr375]SES22815.1 AAA ATPase domain-containing protein [Streptomyces sp. yr375]